MESFVIRGEKKLKGELQVSSAKNCVLVQMAAAILTDEEVVIRECPNISDVENMRKILVALGAKAERQGSSMVIKAENMTGNLIPEQYCKKIRSSVFMLGSLLGRFRKAGASFPGGCSIGKRPVDLHIAGFKSLNVGVEENEDSFFCDGRNMRSAEVCVSRSVGATENMIMSAVLLDGESVIYGSAEEPEVRALCDMLNSMGGRIEISGSVIKVQGVKKLGGTEVLPIPDRIVAGSYICAAAVTEGELYIKNSASRYLSAFIEKVDGYSCDIKYYGDDILVKGREKRRGVGILNTAPYPGFPTDLQAPITTVLCVSKGQSVVCEKVFETRMKHVGELAKMGAEITDVGRKAYISGVKRLVGANVTAYDLRGGAAMVLAALNAEGETVVMGAEHIDRGYECVENRLSEIGADIRRIIKEK